jgi:hypothetical protein
LGKAGRKPEVAWGRMWLCSGSGRKRELCIEGVYGGMEIEGETSLRLAGSGSPVFGDGSEVP